MQAQPLTSVNKLENIILKIIVVSSTNVQDVFAALGSDTEAASITILHDNARSFQSNQATCACSPRAKRKEELERKQHCDT